MHQPAAAITVAVVVIGPFCIFLVNQRSFIEAAVSLNLAIVAGAMIYVVRGFGRDFRNLVVTAQLNKEISAENARLAHIDVVTQLGNRRAFFNDLVAAHATGNPYVVMILDLDGFKQVNDQHGHALGDKVLQQVGARLAGVIGELSPARLGGDEFGVVITGSHPMDEAVQFAEASISAISEPIVVSGIKTRVGVSIGISAAALDERAELGYERADYALYDAKRSGRGRCSVFDDRQSAELLASIRLEKALQEADIDSEFNVVYQPIVDAKSFDVVAYEALARWQSPTSGPISPARFIPLAEKNGLVTHITRFVLKTSLMESSNWPHGVKLKVNLSLVDLLNESHVSDLCSLISLSPIAADRVTFEITETTFAENFDQIYYSISKLKKLGCGIALDDFGVEYSSLRYIQRLSPTVIKIDKSFVDAIEHDDASQSIIRTVIQLARNVGATSVAEGVETNGQALLLRHFGCDELQGYLFSHPVPGSDLPKKSEMIKGRQRTIPAVAMLR